jgi:putative Holliday junction resolvase
MGRIVAVDYGSKRVGLAATDPLKIIASPIGTFHSAEVLDFLADYHSKETIETLVVGMPRTLTNMDTNATPLVKGFITLLKKKLPGIPVVTVDERFTSKIASQAMLTGGMKKKDRRVKGNVDKISATIILQSYLASQPI